MRRDWSSAGLVLVVILAAAVLAVRIVGLSESTEKRSPEGPTSGVEPRRPAELRPEPMSHSEAPAARPASADRGRALFRGACAGCHGPDGEGTHAGEAERVPPIGRELTRDAVTNVVRAGRGRMPAFGDLLEPEDVADLAELLGR